MSDTSKHRLDHETAARLKANCEERGFTVEFLETRDLALARLKQLIPAGADVTNGSSTSLAQIGFLDFLESEGHSWRYRRKEITSEPDEQTRHTLRRSATTASYIVGSVNALAITGEAVCADAGGTRIAAYAYGADKVIWIVGINKVVPTLKDAIARVRSLAYPLEDARVRATGGKGSVIGKMLTIEAEIAPGRIRLILVQEELGF